MKEIDLKQIVFRFNDCINNKDLDGLAQLMTDDHTFVERDGSEQKPKNVMIQNWMLFFKMFPVYRNTFTQIESRDNLVVIAGYAYWSDKQPHDPILWTAKIKNNLIQEWRIYEDTKDNRRLLKIKLK